MLDIFFNVEAIIPGTRKDDPRILVIGSHYDTKRTDAEHDFEFVGAIDGGGATGVLLELARGLKAQPPKGNVWLIFFDGEESLRSYWEDPDNRYGSRHHVDRLEHSGELERVRPAYEQTLATQRVADEARTALSRAETWLLDHPLTDGYDRRLDRLYIECLERGGVAAAMPLYTS